VTALAAVSLRRGRGQRVTLAIHYNVSQAEEMANRSLIPRDGWLYKRMQREERQAIRGSDNVVSCSQFMRSNLERHDPGGGRILVIPNTAKVPIPASDAVERDLIAVGTLEPRKNQQFLLRVLAEARRRGYRYTISIVGSGEDAERLQSLSKELGIADQAFFLGRKNAAPLLSAHKVLVHGALIENLPIALIEALAAGVPILAPAVGGIPEVFDEGVEGRFWYLNDVEASASILIETMEDTAGLAAMSRAARTRYRETFDREVVFEKLTEVIDG
jgi:glycosyltransferase involved in cell wall biosynthesis